jgi:hypothetical protein
MASLAAAWLLLPFFALQSTVSSQVIDMIKNTMVTRPWLEIGKIPFYFMLDSFAERI